MLNIQDVFDATFGSNTPYIYDTMQAAADVVAASASSGSAANRQLSSSSSSLSLRDVHVGLDSENTLSNLRVVSITGFDNVAGIFGDDLKPSGAQEPCSMRDALRPQPLLSANAVTLRLSAASTVLILVVILIIACILSILLLRDIVRSLIESQRWQRQREPGTDTLQRGNANTTVSSNGISQQHIE